MTRDRGPPVVSTKGIFMNRKMYALFIAVFLTVFYIIWKRMGNR